MANAPKPCSVESCNNFANNAGGGARGLCRKHYVRLMRHGHPEGGRTAKGEAIAFARKATKHTGPDCLIWPFSEGRPSITIRGERHIASRWICEAVNGPPPTPAHHAAHSCGKGHLGCVSGAHLEWKTASENQMDRIEHQTSNRGERNHFAVLSESDVLEIRRLHGTVNQKALAERYGVSKSSIQDIQYRKSWTWLP